MRVLALSLTVVLGAVCSAQTKAPAPTHTAKTPLSQCRADLQDAQKARDGWADLNTQLEARNKELEAQNKELEAKNAESRKKTRQSRGPLENCSRTTKSFIQQPLSFSTITML
jgi:Skp family chaperone for outer membrane proteins